MTPGTIVECIDDSIPPEQYIEVRRGERYTVAWYGTHTSYLAGDYMGVRLVGIHRGACPFTGDEDPPFRAERFRVVQMPKAPARELEEAL